MFNSKELIYISLAIIVGTFIIYFNELSKGANSSIILLLFTLIIMAITIIVNISAKKIAAYYYEAKIETKIWMWERYGIKRGQHFKTPIPAGILIPALISIISFGYFIWLTLLEFDVFATTARAAKKHGMYRFTDMTDIHIGLIAASGVVANLITAILGYIAGFPEFSRLSIFYAFFSMIPFGNLDGTKIFFGSKNIWIGLGIIVLIFLSYVLFFPY